MKIKAKKVKAGKPQHMKPGQEYEVTDELGKILIAKDVAEEVKPKSK